MTKASSLSKKSRPFRAIAACMQISECRIIPDRGSPREDAKREKIVDLLSHFPAVSLTCKNKGMFAQSRPRQWWKRQHVHPNYKRWGYNGKLTGLELRTKSEILDEGGVSMQSSSHAANDGSPASHLTHIVGKSVQLSGVDEAEESHQNSCPQCFNDSQLHLTKLHFDILCLNLATNNMNEHKDSFGLTTRIFVRRGFLLWHLFLDHATILTFLCAGDSVSRRWSGSCRPE